jgi:putative cell wall-binding protein
VTTGSSSVGCLFYFGTTDPPTGTTSSVTVPANETDYAVPIDVSGLTAGDTYYFYLYCDGLAGSVLSFVASTTTSPITQIYGSDPVGTAIAIAQAEFPGADSAGAVVLARSDFFSDALAGGPLAAHVNGPLLLTPGASISDEIDPRVMSEIEYVLPAGSVVYILGGDLALSPNIDSALISLGYTVVREAGQDEYATAVDIAQAIGNPNTILLATGISFYDALSADPAAIKLGGAILLTDGATEAPETASYLAQFPGDIVYAIGGPDQALGADPSAIGIWGASLLDTSAAVASYFFPDASTYGAATDLDFSDALAGGVYMATGGRMGPLLLVDPGSPTLWPSVAAYLGGLASGTPGVVFGGPEAVPSNVVELLETAVG